MKKLIGIVALTSMAGLVACGGGQAKQQGAGAIYQDAPSWVLDGSGAFPGEKGRVFYGVGQMKGSSNPSLLRSMSDTRARADIAKTLNSYTAVLSKSYQAATTAGDMSKDTATSDEQHVQEAIKQFTSIETSGIEIVKHWYAPDGSIFSLARLDLQGMKDNLDKMKELNARVRDAVRANADKAFDELAAEEAKKKAGQ